MIRINNKEYNIYKIQELYSEFEALYGKDSFELTLAVFLTEWVDNKTQLKVYTSGSTGTPKEIWVDKERMKNSAQLTLSFLGLNKGDSALLCMPLKYIAGKMVVVRCLEGNLNLYTVSPCGRPLEHLETIPDFAAMIPMQVYNSLQYDADRAKLKQIKHLIIGGGAIDEKMENELKSFPNAVWSTYGMTETLSHIALRRISGKEASSWYTPFDNVKISLSEENTLVIHAPSVNPDILVTNDIVELNSTGQFRIIGRKDNTINTGGVKVQIEQIESKLKVLLPKGVDFMITSVKDRKFGERVVMLISTLNISYNDIEKDIEKAVAYLPKYWQPKQIIKCNELPLTETGKPDRAKARKTAETLVWK